ncbi:Crp/Fnr family transcriptional regulator [Rurimicrobium arvi]|uniref:Crp/Fnr family transcriptional regulator n=1 Tax=Rurimicrobium arvi TaxID=2049916 RepID=A0ABP8MKV4_9BACT
MDTSVIIAHTRRFIELDKQEELYFLSLLQEKKFSRKAFLLRENEICDHAAFVLSGCFRAYSIDENGVEHILQFAPRNWWITDMYSLLSHKPAHLNIDALEETEALLLSRKNQEMLYQEVPKFERYFRILVENSLVANRQRVLDNLELSAKERYAKFCSTYPTLINSVPQKQIAAYIGVTPEFLSKMKAEYWRETSG